MKEFLLFFMIFYVLSGVMLFVCSSKITHQSDVIGKRIPEEHVTYVVTMFLAWPLRSWIYRHYRHQLSR